MTYPIRTRPFAVALFLCFLGISCDAVVIAQTDPPDDVQEPAEAPGRAADNTSWIDQVDGMFGTYLVAPLERVIFYPVYTVEREFTYENTVTGKSGSEIKKTTAPFIVVWLLVGAIFFTLVMGFINFRGFVHAIRLTKGDYDNPDDEGEVSHFQALASALSGTVGLGNIAGVAIAVGQGGPGATFWMILVGLLGMTSKFTECTLGQMYREVDETGRVRGGPMRYLNQGLAEMKLGPFGKVLAVLFAILCIGGALGGGNTFQISQSLDAFRNDVPIIEQQPWIYGLIMSVLIGAVVIGGIKSIGRVASKIVPFMCAGYVICALYILITNAGQIPSAVWSILSGAFSADAMYGGFLGCLVIGIRRAVFSNEAGAGSASIAHSAAKTQIPVREGFVALLEPFIDTVVVCTMTALVIIITGVCKQPYDSVPMDYVREELVNAKVAQVQIESKSDEELRDLAVAANPSLDRDEDGVLTVKDYIDRDRGAFFTKQAFVKGGAVWFKWFLYAAVVLFAFSTCITWYYYGERCFTALFGDRSSGLFKVIFLLFSFLGSIVATTNIKNFSDMLILGMAFPNMLGMYFLCWRVRRHLNEYWDQLKRGEVRPTK